MFCGGELLEQLETKKHAKVTCRDLMKSVDTAGTLIM
jgi:hypothetical protein